MHVALRAQCAAEQQPTHDNSGLCCAPNTVMGTEDPTDAYYQYYFGVVSCGGECCNTFNHVDGTGGCAGTAADGFCVRGTGDLVTS